MINKKRDTQISSFVDKCISLKHPGLLVSRLLEQRMLVDKPRIALSIFTC